MKKLLNYPLKRTRRKDAESSWKLKYINFQPAKEPLREALCTLGNGYLGTRGAHSESVASRIHYPGTYIAGVYNKLKTHIVGKDVTNEDMVNSPDWLLLTFRVEGGNWVVTSQSKILFYYQELDIHNGVLSRRLRIQDEKRRRFTVETQRIVHMENPHLAVLRYTIIPENYKGWITIRAGLDGDVQNTGVARYRQLNSKHLLPDRLKKIDNKTIQLSVKTSQSRIIISEAARTRIFQAGKELKPKSNLVLRSKKAIYQDFKVYVQKNKEYTVEKIVSIYTSKDKDIKNPNSAAVDAIRKPYSFRTLLETHKNSWHRLWKLFDIRIQGDVTFQKVIRLHIFHLLQTASLNNVNIDAGFPARGLHGESYRGHIFWDELFIMPFYSLHTPRISRALLLYRYRRLGQARINAKQAGYKGAMFPWQSGVTGDEQTQSMHLNPMSGKWGADYSHNQRHVSFAVAYNVWRYWKNTNDIDFLIKYGAEMMLSISQFGVSLLKYDERDQRYHTEGLMGPDEFHERLTNTSKAGFKDNAYTNFLIVATLLNTMEILEVLPRDIKNDLLERLEIDKKELHWWEDITRKTNIIISRDGVISQFDGYFKLKELNWDSYRKKYGHIERMDRILKAEGKSPNAYKVAKQADVLMIFYLFSLHKIKFIFSRLGYKFAQEILKKNYEYYIKRTSHGSTLSKVVHCYIAHLLGKQAEAWHWFLEVLKSDIYDTQGGTTPEGIHVGVMGGSINIALKSFVGLELLEDRIMINPSLPKDWRKVKFRFLYRKRWISLSVNRRRISIFIRGPKLKSFPVPIDIYGRQHNLLFGRSYKIPLRRYAPGAVWGGVPKMVQERILIVDGDIMQAVVLKSRLEDLGYLADCAYNGNNALSILKSGWVDLIILAVVLRGEMSGYQLLKEIRRNKQLCKIPVIMQSKKPGLRYVFETLGVKRYFIRPYSVNRLIKEVKDIIGENL